MLRYDLSETVIDMQPNTKRSYRREEEDETVLDAHRRYRRAEMGRGAMGFRRYIPYHKC
jgi:hypothetical protein